MASMRRIDDQERRARLGVRHRLANPADDPVEATSALTALHSSDPATVFLSVWARVPGFETGHLESALYSDRSLVRLYGMRRTLWVIARHLVPHVHNSSTRFIGESERRRTVRLLEDGGVTDDGDAWLDEVIPKTLAVIAEHGQILTRDLTRVLPELQGRLTFHNRQGRLMATTGLSSRTLLQLAVESRVIRGQPTGTWISGQYRWALTDHWLGMPIQSVDVAEASATLLASWLRSFGPATEADVRWWTGWPVRQVRKALEDVAACTVELAQGIGYVLAEDVGPVEIHRDWVAILPSLDATTMGWKQREWYLGRHADLLFDRNGNAGPTIWVNGRIVGGWAQRKDGNIVHELLEDVGKEAATDIEARLADLQGWLGETTITPRFRSPHDKKLAP